MSGGTIKVYHTAISNPSPNPSRRGRGIFLSYPIRFRIFRRAYDYLNPSRKSLPRT